MIAFLVFTTISVILFIISLLVKIYLLSKKLKYVDEANMWHKLAITDGLTRVYNRHAYNNLLIKMRENIIKKVYGIILFDIDDFKLFNDTKGHLAGDEILKKVAKTLLDMFPEPKYKVFRMGGDEFLVISENVSEREIIKRLLSLREILESDSDIRLSKGYSMVKDNIDEAFEYADEMLYVDKLSKNCNLHI